MSGWIKNILSTEQKKSDFRPEEHGVGLVERTMVIIIIKIPKHSPSIFMGVGVGYPFK